MDDQTTRAQYGPRVAANARREADEAWRAREVRDAVDPDAGLPRYLRRVILEGWTARECLQAAREHFPRAGVTMARVRWVADRLGVMLDAPTFEERMRSAVHNAPLWD